MVVFLYGQNTNFGYAQDNNSRASNIARIVARTMRSDSNRNGTIERREASGGIAENFDQLDSNNSGVLERTEIVAMARFVVARSNDSNEVLTPDSFAWSGPIGPKLTDVDGKPQRPLDPGPDKATVLIFTTHDCPIANNYAPLLNDLVQKHEADPIRFYLVHVDPEIPVETVEQHRKDYNYRLPILVDRDHLLVGRTGVSHTPEAVVILRDGSMAYRGRIDDLYFKLGRKRSVVTTSELVDAIDAVLGDRRVDVPRTVAVGCNIPIR